MTSTDRHPRRWWILGVLSLALLTVSLDNTVLNVALPSLTSQLHASTEDVQWALNAYTLTLAGLLITAGGVADRYGRKRVLLIGLLLFGIGSLAAALSVVPWQLIAARAVMGVGGVFLLPCTLAVLVLVFDIEERPKAIGIWAAVSSAGLAVGPVLGGFLLQHFWWGSVFLVNVPVVLAGLVGVALIVPESRNPHGERLDLPGAALSTVAMVGLVWTVAHGAEGGWSPAAALFGAAVGLLALAGFVMWERRATHPMVDLTMFASPQFRGAATGGILAAFGMGGSLFLLTQDLQFVHGYQPVEAGVRIMPLAITVLLSSSLLSARVSARCGGARTMAFGMTVASGGLATIALVASDAGVSTLIGLVLVGVGIGLAMPAAAHALMSAIPRERAGTGSGVNGTLQELGSALGVAVLGSVLVARFATALPSGLGPAAQRSLPAALTAAGGQPDATALAHQIRAAFAASMSFSQLVGAFAVLAGGITAGVLLRRAEVAGPARSAVADETTHV